MLLFVDNERAPFFDKNIQRFRRKEFQERLLKQQQVIRPLIIIIVTKKMSS